MSRCNPVIWQRRKSGIFRISLPVGSVLWSHQQHLISSTYPFQNLEKQYLQANVKRKGEKAVRKKKNSQKLNDHANAATAAGMTCGQQAAEYAKAVIVRPVPSGYRKAGEFTRKKWEEDL